MVCHSKRVFRAKTNIGKIKKAWICTFSPLKHVRNANQTKTYLHAMRFFRPKNTYKMKVPFTVFYDFRSVLGARARGSAPLASLERQILSDTPTRVGG